MRNALILFIGILFFCSCKKEDKTPYTGTLTGRISYTGASNLEIDNVIITLHKVDATTEEGSWRIDKSGDYSFDLPEGDYLMELKGNRCKSDSLPDNKLRNCLNFIEILFY
ncbi:MAG: hypothetical protein LBT48_00195 [Prevotellaceae bacterium]|jgi:hypothetical protein|nr:hypothetical protein [Prevotellaceae bacterium]